MREMKLALSAFSQLITQLYNSIEKCECGCIQTGIFGVINGFTQDWCINLSKFSKRLPCM